MSIISLHNQEEIETFLRRNTFLHLYTLGDLDDFFWPYTTWYGRKPGSEITELVLLYTGTSLPTLLALSEQTAAMRSLLQSITHLLPRRFYAHLSDDLTAVFAPDYDVHSHGLHHKMALTDYSMLPRVDTTAVIPLTPADKQRIESLYESSYPDNWFDPRMLETGHYFGLEQDGQLVTVAGIHVYSPRYKVAALGNVTTHPDYRGRGLASAVCAKLCQVLSQTVDHIGLNVKADNKSAIAAYEKLGFTHVGSYEEALFEWQA